MSVHNMYIIHGKPLSVTNHNPSLFDEVNVFCRSSNDLMLSLLYKDYYILSSHL